jgi:hypothetical protein
LTTSIYFPGLPEHDEAAGGETFNSARESTAERESDCNMGDRSPKANQKKSNQKQVKNNHVAAKKKAAVASKQAAAKKK